MGAADYFLGYLSNIMLVITLQIEVNKVVKCISQQILFCDSSSFNLGARTWIKKMAKSG
jgi:hypothetical protein